MDMLGNVMAALGMNARRAVRVGDPATEPAPAVEAAPRRSTTAMPIAPFNGGPRRVFRQDQPLGVGAVLNGYRAPPSEEQQKREMEAARRAGTEGGRLGFLSSNAPRFSDDTGARSSPMGPGGAAAASRPSEVAARETGVDAQFIERLVGHESGGDERARPIDPVTRRPRSTAVGHGQFIDQTWIDMMDEYGPGYGLNPNLSRAEKLRLREDPQWSALMTGHYAQANAEHLRRAMGRNFEPSAGDVYMMHFLGPRDAVAVLKANREGRGNIPARSIVDPDSVAANPEVFLLPSGRPRSVRELIERQTRNFQYEGNNSIRARRAS